MHERRNFVRVLSSYCVFTSIHYWILPRMNTAVQRGMWLCVCQPMRYQIVPRMDGIHSSTGAQKKARRWDTVFFTLDVHIGRDLVSV
ncbi:hypothetical protein BU16DRAFT_531821, partial [Lophium mytilinum]